MRIRRDSVFYQCLAVAEVLTPPLTWATRASCHPNIPEYADDEGTLTDVADRLIARARTILTGLASPAR
ncbi:hypothetical protein GCM10027290_30110 [Micromonospora sonneratiae]|uniref:Low molecular weight phosphotyrosine protein phosphatase n=1 Tax=Micromonospora sonneratiae TaxID=1184706 RepID=A0ABW3YHZ3_9ACTN